MVPDGKGFVPCQTQIAGNDVDGFFSVTVREVVFNGVVWDADPFSCFVLGVSEAGFVKIDFAHHRKSTCDCPHAEGRRVVCKHKVALAFAVSPEALKKADDIMEEQLRYQAERETREHEQYERIKKKVMEMSLEDLRDYVIYQMIEDENKYDPNYDDEEFFDW